jgi:hypothetical protein
MSRSTSPTAWPQLLPVTVTHHTLAARGSFSFFPPKPKPKPAQPPSFQLFPSQHSLRCPLLFCPCLFLGYHVLYPQIIVMHLLLIAFFLSLWSSSLRLSQGKRTFTTDLESNDEWNGCCLGQSCAFSLRVNAT